MVDSTKGFRVIDTNASDITENNRKSHMGFRLIPTSMTLNDLERRTSPYFAYFSTEFDCFADQLRHSGRR